MVEPFRVRNALVFMEKGKGNPSISLTLIILTCHTIYCMSTHVIGIQATWNKYRAVYNGADGACIR